METPNARIETQQVNCSECGMLHPPCPPGTCPIAKEQTINQEAASAGSERLVRLFQAIQSKLLEKLKDKPEDYATAVAEQLFRYIEQL